MRWWWRAPCALKATAKPGNWQNKLSEPVVPLSNIQIDVLRLLAAHRDPESYVAGATPLNRNTARYSDDIDVFHDREERVATAALHDVTVLEAAGYRVVWLRQLPLLYTVEGSPTATPAHAWNGSWTAITGFSRQCTMRRLVTSCIRLIWP
jgi:hypothetical protein